MDEEFRILRREKRSFSGSSEGDFVFGFEGIFNKAQWLSWLERRPVTAEVEGSSPFWVVNLGS